MNDRELMQQALDALEYPGPSWPEARHDVAKALRAALANEFNPDWDAMAVMVEEQQRMAKRIEELKERLLQVELKPSTARLAQPEQPDWSKAGFGKPQPEPKVYSDIDEMFRDMGVQVTKQEPVAWMHPERNTYTRAPAMSITPKEDWIPLYTAPINCTCKENEK